MNWASFTRHTLSGNSNGCITAHRCNSPCCAGGVKRGCGSRPDGRPKSAVIDRLARDSFAGE